MTHHHLVFNLQSQNHALCLLLSRYGVVLLLAAWLPVVFGLVHLCLQKTDNPLSLVQFLVGWLFFPLVQPALYIRLLLLHQVFVACCTMRIKGAFAPRIIMWAEWKHEKSCQLEVAQNIFKKLMSGPNRMVIITLITWLINTRTRRQSVSFTESTRGERLRWEQLPEALKHPHRWSPLLFLAILILMTMMELVKPGDCALPYPSGPPPPSLAGTNLRGLPPRLLGQVASSNFDFNCQDTQAMNWIKSNSF